MTCRAAFSLYSVFPAVFLVGRDLSLEGPIRDTQVVLNGLLQGLPQRGL